MRKNVGAFCIITDLSIQQKRGEDEKRADEIVL